MSDPEDREFPKRWRDAPEAAPEAARLLARIPAPEPLDALALGRIRAAVLRRAERTRAAPPRFAIALAGLVGAAGALAVILRLLGGAAGEITVARCQSERLRGDGGLRVALIGPAAARIDSDLVSLRDGAVLIDSGDRERTVIAGAARVKIKPRKTAQVTLHEGRVTVAAWAGGATVLWQGQNIEVAAGTEWRPEGVATLASDGESASRRLGGEDPARCGDEPGGAGRAGAAGSDGHRGSTGRPEGGESGSPGIANGTTSANPDRSSAQPPTANRDSNSSSPSPRLPARPSANPGPAPFAQAAARRPGETGAVTPAVAEAADLEVAIPRGALQAERELLERALARRRAGDPAGVLAALAGAPGAGSGERLLLRVWALQSLGREADALELLDGVSLAGLPRAVELTVLRGELRARVARYADAEGDFGAALRDSPSAPLAGRALYGRATCRAALGQPAAARDDLREYLHRFPDGPFAAPARRILAP